MNQEEIATMKKYNAVIFDLDGVLCSTDMYHYQAWKVLADSLGIPFDEEVNKRLRGVSRMASLEIILEKSTVSYTEEEKVRFATQKNDVYKDLLRNMTPADVSEDVRYTLEKLHEGGVKLAVGSSSKNTPFILERTDMRRYFDAVSDGNNITHSKPDPEVFLKAAEMVGEKPGNCMIVEDAEAGIEAGVNGGFTTASIGDARDKGLGDYKLQKLSDLLPAVFGE